MRKRMTPGSLGDRYRPVMLYRRLTAPWRVRPSFLVIGAMRSGTTTLFSQIIRHPDMRPPLIKEPHYFDYRPGYPMNWYRAQFPFSGVSGEGSAMLMFERHVPQLVHERLGRVKLVAILRDPVERAFSHHHNSLSRFGKAPSLRTLLARRDHLQWKVRWILPVGRYDLQLPKWRELFGEDLLVLLHEEFVADQQAAMDRVFAHIGVPPHRVDPGAWTNPTGRRQDPELEAVRGELADFYAPTRAYVSEMLGRQVPWQGG